MNKRLRKRLMTGLLELRLEDEAGPRCRENMKIAERRRRNGGGSGGSSDDGKRSGKGKHEIKS